MNIFNLIIYIILYIRNNQGAKVCLAADLSFGLIRMFGTLRYKTVLGEQLYDMCTVRLNRQVHGGPPPDIFGVHVCAVVEEQSHRVCRPLSRCPENNNKRSYFSRKIMTKVCIFFFLLNSWKKNGSISFSQDGKFINYLNKINKYYISLKNLLFP